MRQIIDCGFVEINRSISFKQMLAITGREQDFEGDLISTIPECDKNGERLLLIKTDSNNFGRYGREKEWLTSLQLPFRLSFCHPITLVQWNIDHIKDADDFSTMAYWVDAEGHWNYIQFLQSHLRDFQKPLDMSGRPKGVSMEDWVVRVAHCPHEGWFYGPSVACTPDFLDAS